MQPPQITIRKKFIFIVIPLTIILSLVSYFIPAYFFRNNQPTISPSVPITIEPNPAEAVEGIASTSPSIITLNESTDVIVTIEITDTRLIPTSVNLQRLDSTGKVLSILGTLNDSGTNSDTAAGDKIFSTKYTFTQSTTTPVYLRVSWALKGVLRRMVSNTLKIEIYQWQTLDNNTLPYSFRYPSTWIANINEDISVDIIGQVTSRIPIKPGDMGGICKVSSGFFENFNLLSLSDWLKQAEEETGAPPPLSTAPITIAGITGIKEIIEETALTTTVYLPVGNKIFSIELICGDEALNKGEEIFSYILESINLK